MTLVHQAQAGDSESFAELYNTYVETVYRYVYYRVGRRETAEDLTSETFLRALRGISTFTWEGRDFGAWLVTIARNLVTDEFTSGRFRHEVATGELLDTSDVEDDAADIVVRSVTHTALLHALRRLPPRMREVAWRHATGVDNNAIATELSMARSTVRVHLRQIRLRLRADPILRAAVLAPSS
ncbi:sigma-70 family RNA polymerase sigma factor [Streptodolium elevatio]|uniref:sigma-70 family RNA polymerase sigma factor n=1 Tax=Streptodolium elevatio TaxID=3157996 RepID=UPI003F4D3833